MHRYITKMLQLFLTLFLISGSKCLNKDAMLMEIATLKYSTNRKQPKGLDELEHVAHFGDAEHRGPAWYDLSSDDNPSDSAMDSKLTDSSSGVSSDTSVSSSFTNEASSIESNDKELAKRVYRSCTPCPYDMLKKFSNIGIKWICGKYQRARRSFKSECMMRFRNCEDGTMFTKVSEHKCANDTYFGRHWFYDYKV